MNPTLRPPNAASRPAPPRGSRLGCPTIRALGTALMAALLLFAPSPLRAQEDGLRVGLTLGGTGLLGVSLEVVEDGRSLELVVGTLSFRDVALSLVGRQYFGASAMKPAAGLGVWSVISFPDEPGARRGISVLARAPIGFDWRASPGHFVGAELSVNRALWIQHEDPTDDAPPNARLIPIPGFAYRWQP